MKIEYTSESRVDIKLSNGKSIIIMYSPNDELSIAFIRGKRNLKELQNRSDGYSGATFSKAE